MLDVNVYHPLKTNSMYTILFIILPVVLIAIGMSILIEGGVFAR